MSITLEKLTNAFREAVAETFENLIFAEVEECRVIQQWPEEEGKDFIVGIETTKPLQGNVFMAFGRDLAEEVFREMSGGEDMEATQEMTRDALKEIINTVAGRFAAHLTEGEEADLGLPEAIANNDLDQLMTSEKNPLFLHLKMEEWEVYCLLTGYEFDA